MITARLALVVACVGSLISPALGSGFGSSQQWAPPHTLDRSGLDSLVGTRSEHPTNLSATSYAGGSLISGRGGVFSHRYAISQFRVAHRQYVTLDSLADTVGHRLIWKVLDAVWVPPFPPSLTFSAGCTPHAQIKSGDINPDRSVLGIAVPQDAQFYSRVLFAWKADTLKRQFALVSPKALECYNDGWGVD